MKVTAAVSLALAGSAMAAGAADTVNQVLQQVASDLKEFDAAIKAYSGDTSQMLSAAKKIEQTTSSGAGQIQSGPDLSLTDAVGITSNVQSLQTTLDATLSDLKGIGEKLAAAGQCSTMLENLSSQSKAAQALQDAITAKAPTETKAVAQQLGGAIGASIEDANSFFKKTCANAPSGGSSGGAAGGSSSGSTPSSGSAPAGDMSAHGGAGGHGGSAGGSTGGSSAGSAGSGTKTNKAAKTSAPAKPATYTGAGNTLTIPFLGAIALAILAL